MTKKQNSIDVWKKGVFGSMIGMIILFVGKGAIAVYF